MLPTPELPNVDLDRVYEPAEDSYLLLDSFEDHRQQLQKRFAKTVPLVVEVGTGSGVVSAFIRQHVFLEAAIMASDINPAACEAAQHTLDVNGGRNCTVSDSLRMDLTSAFRRAQIDLLVFNPPYVPAEEVPEQPKSELDRSWLDLALLGGADGMVVTWRLLDQLDSILSPRGVAYVLFCARNKPENVARVMEGRGWRVQTAIHRKAGWEVLSVLTFERA